MRLADRITFVSLESNPIYDLEMSKWLDGKTVKTTVPANVSDLGVTSSMRDFQDVSKERKVVRLKRPYPAKFDFVEYRGNKFKAINFKLDSEVFYIERDEA